MRTTLYTIICILFLNDGMAQKLELNEIIQLRNKDYDYIDTYLIKKGWQFSGSKGNNLQPAVTWALNATITDKADCWFHWWKIGTNNNIVSYEFHESQYSKIKSNIETQGYKLIKNEHNENMVTSIYEKGSTIIVLNIKAGFFNIKSYSISVCSYGYLELLKDKTGLNGKSNKLEIGNWHKTN